MTKITKIKTKLVKGNVSAHDFGKSMDYLIVKIDTDENITGIAILPELFQFSQSESLTTVVKPLIENILGNIIIGKDPTSIEAIWEELFIKTTRWGRRGLILQAISTIDVALWDILGKLSNKPIWQLLGGYRKVVPTYANTAYQLSPDELANKAKELVSKGFKAVKIRGTLTAVTPEEATERIKKVREAIGPDIKLMVDLNGSYTTELALKMLQRWERYDLYWVEEPVHPDNLEGYKKIKKSTDIKIAAGEQHFTIYDFKILIENELVDIVQPDVYVVGGVTEWLNVWSLAKAYDVQVSPHLAPVESAHLVAAKPNTMWIEYVPPDNYLRATLFQVLDEPSSILYAKNGVVTVNEMPGFGYKLKAKYEF